jgi:hypothetical protein
MNTARKPDGQSRRQFLKTSTSAAIVVVAGAIIHPGEGWGLEAKALKPETMRTLVVMARDIYPHDRLADRFYAVAVKGFDAKASKDDAVRAAFEQDIADLDQVALKSQGAPYALIGWERDRVEILRGMERGAFFQQIRGTMVVSLYNQKEVWPAFGYQGESASQGGYLHRGFDDIAWL